MFKKLITFLTGALPILESRAAIPLGLGFGFSPLKSYFLGIAGTMILIIPLLSFWEFYANFWMKRSSFVNWYLTGIYKRTRDKYSEKFEVLGFFALLLFTAIPLPGTGVYTASVIAYVFKYPFWKAFFAISLGLLISGVLIIGISLGIISIF